MTTYLGKFAPNLSDVTAPLRDLTKKENAFIWDAVSEKAYNSMKQLLCKEPGPVLAYFDPQKDVVLQCDASQKGMGAALLQEQHPISYASRCMTSAEQNYAQIEKELLAVVFACGRFHQYTYGRDTTVQSDHKPLEAITNKPLACAPPRLQRMLIRLQRHNVKVVYVPGKQIPLADTLSRIFVKIEPKLPRHDLEDSVRVHDTLTTSDLSEEVGVFEILHTAVTDARIEKVRAAMKHDQSMQILIRTIQSGWPNERRRCPKQIQDFWNIRDELAIVDDESSPLVIKGHRIYPLSSVKKFFSNFTSDTSALRKPSNASVMHERDHGQTRYTRTGIFRQWAAILMRGICTICKHNYVDSFTRHPVPDTHSRMDWQRRPCRPRRGSQ